MTLHVTGSSVLPVTLSGAPEDLAHILPKEVQPMGAATSQAPERSVLKQSGASSVFSGKDVDKRRRFTIYHGFAASLLLHSAVGMAVLVQRLMPSEQPETLALELQGVVADVQTDQKVAQETKGQATQDTAEVAAPEKPAPPPEKAASPQQEPTDSLPETNKEASAPLVEPKQFSQAAEQTPPSPPAETKPPVRTEKLGNPGTNNVVGVDEKQNAQTITAEHALTTYLKELKKKVQTNFMSLYKGQQGTATVSLRILTSGQIRPESLKIAASSGQPKLDAGALAAIRASAPFEPPPKEITVGIDVGFGRKH